MTHLRNFFIYTLLLSFLFSQENNNSTLSIGIPSGVKIEVSGEAEIELVDVEGKGGAQYEDNFVKKIETRSPYAQIDKTVLKFKLLYTKNLTYNFSLRFDDDGAYADKHYLKYKKKNTQLEFGKNRPLIALKRNTEGYPLIGTAYWKGREYHLDLEHKISFSILGASVALKRPIGYDDAAEDRSFRMMVYDDTEKIDGQTIEYGLRSQISVSNLKLQSWYYFGKLIDDEDWKKRLHYDFDYYAEIEPDTILSENANINHFWLGGRAELSLLGSLLRAEYIYSKDGYLPRDGFYFEWSHSFDTPVLPNKIFLLGRYGELRIDANRTAFPLAWAEDNNLPVLKDPQTWDRKMTSLAFAYEITPFAKIKAEYYILDEITGDTKIYAEGDPDDDFDDRPFQPSVDDNQLLLQLELNF